MALVNEDIVYVRAHSSAIRLWKYTTTDSHATATGGGYFQYVMDKCLPGDLLLVAASDGTSLRVWPTTSIGQYGVPPLLVTI